MNRRVRAALLVIGFALSSCAPPPAPPPSAPPPAPPIAGAAILPFGSVSNARNVRDLAGPGTYLAPLPTAFILLKPGSPQNTPFCQAWTAGSPTMAQAASQSNVRQNLIPTSWLVKTDSPAYAEIAGDCGALIADYDYDRAAAYLRALQQAAQDNKTAFDPSGPGPFVVIVVAGVYDSAGTIVVDASKLNDMTGFVHTYQDRILQVAATLNSPPGAPAPSGPKQGSAEPMSGGILEHPWFLGGLLGIVATVLSFLWPGAGPLITVIKTVICG